MILAAHQPVYLPWLGLFHKIYLSDLFCVFDIAQYQTKDYNNRNKIKTHNGEIWLTVPVESKNHFSKKISDIRIIQNGWHAKHIKSIMFAYKKAPFFEKYFDGLSNILNKRHIFLTDLNTDILRFMLECLNMTVPIVKASDYNFVGSKSDLVLDMCVKLGAAKYIFGAQGANYADIQAFTDQGIEVYFQNYQHPVYSQLHGAYIPFMSTLDLLFNAGPSAKNILLSNNIVSLK